MRPRQADRASEIGPLRESLAAADFNGDGSDDLAVGTSWEDVVELNVGGVNVIYGSRGGLTSAGNQLWPGQAGHTGQPATFRPLRLVALERLTASGHAEGLLSQPWRTVLRTSARRSGTGGSG
jgi:FG-GAP repeat